MSTKKEHYSEEEMSDIISYHTGLNKEDCEKLAAVLSQYSFIALKGISKALQLIRKGKP